MKRKSLLAGLMAGSMLILSGCGHNSSIVEATVVNKNSYNYIVTLEYNGFYDKCESRKIFETVEIGKKIKVIKKDYKDLNGRIYDIDLDIP